MKRLGRFTKEEILEAEERFILGHSLYKIGREMRRSQASIKSHLIKLGLVKFQAETFYENKNEVYSFSFVPNAVDCFILSALMITFPTIGLMYIGLMLLKD